MWDGNADVESESIAGLDGEGEDEMVSSARNNLGQRGSSKPLPCVN